MWSVLFGITTWSIGLNILFVQIYAGKKLWESIRDRDWLKAILAFGGTAGCLLAYHFAFKKIILGFASYGWAGAIKATITIGPEAIGLFNKFLAALMATIIGVGFIPGGKIGFFIGAILSICLNVINFWLAADWLKAIVVSPRSKKPAYKR